MPSLHCQGSSLAFTLSFVCPCVFFVLLFGFTAGGTHGACSNCILLHSVSVCRWLLMSICWLDIL